MKKIWNKIVIYLRPFCNLKFALCFLVAWTITNGWCYIFIGVGTACNIKWMYSIGISYLAFLWLPCTPEKIVTIPLAILFQRWFFRKDIKTKKQLEEMYYEAKQDWKRFKLKCSDLIFKMKIRIIYNKIRRMKKCQKKKRN